MRTLITTGLLLIAGLAPQALAQPVLFNMDSIPAVLDVPDRAFIQHRLDSLVLDGECRMERLGSLPRTDFRVLEAVVDGLTWRIYVLPDVVRSREALLVTEGAGELVAYSHCSQDVLDALLPVLAIISTFRYEGDSDSNQTRQAVLASHSYLTSHEPSMLMVRNDSIDSSATYLDFLVSAKHPLFANAGPLNSLHGNLADTLEKFMPGDNEYFIQLYLAFTGRFSQYILERNSAPVVARNFNPAIFYRFWSSRSNYLDIELGHESNGQRIRTPQGLLREEEDYLSEGEPAFYARDSLSRGWDYIGMSWQRNWNTQWTSQLRTRHFLKDSPIQGLAEEYSTWEDGGDRLRPRRQYDGINLSLQYEFNRSHCLLGTSHICFRNVKYRFDTGYSAVLDNNTNTVELTTDFFGIPIQLWGKSGYNTNLVDYYKYTTSWGLGIELISQ